MALSLSVAHLLNNPTTHEFHKFDDVDTIMSSLVSEASRVLHHAQHTYPIVPSIPLQIDALLPVFCDLLSLIHRDYDAWVPTVSLNTLLRALSRPCVALVIIVCHSIH